MINAKDYGFETGKSETENSAALQAACDAGGDIYISEPGIYDVSECIMLGSNTSIICANGVYLRRNKCENTTYVFANKGALTREYSENIKLIGVRIICDGVVADSQSPLYVPGLRGHVSFFYIKNLEIRDFEIMDLPAANFGIHVCTFHNIIIENVRIEGKKDAVHLGRGDKFVIRHGIFKTFDDPIALNAHDYSTSNPQLGWIENGIIEDCYDMDDSDTTGYFCRVLAGAWGEWKPGMEVQNSDTVSYGGRLYRVIMPADGRIFKSVTPPTHESGIEEYDGIRWVMVQDDVVYGSGCRNIHFKDIFLQKKRPTAFSLHFDKDNYSRSYYPGAESPVQENIIFENIYFQNDIPVFISAVTPIDNIKVINSVVGDSEILLKNIETDGIKYKKTNVLFSGTTFTEKTPTLVRAEEGRSARVSIIGSCVDDDFKPKFEGNVEIK